MLTTVIALRYADLYLHYLNAATHNTNNDIRFVGVNYGDQQNVEILSRQLAACTVCIQAMLNLSPDDETTAVQIETLRHDDFKFQYIFTESKQH